MTVMVEAATALRWVPAGERVVVGQRRLDAGAVYVGDGSDEPSAIDPTLPVDRAQPDWGATSVREKRYAALTPQARAAYLVWLETGRRARQAPSVWPILYLYGLERRILADGDDDPALRTEVQQLDTIYGHDDEVHRIAAGLTTTSSEDRLKVELGRRALASRPVDADLAAAWNKAHPAIPQREAAKTAPEAFDERWTQLFAEEHPDGLLVAPRRRRLTLEHRPGNPSLPTPLERAVEDASDVFDAPGPERILRGITERVESEFETHVRWLRKNKNLEVTETAGTLPHDLVVVTRQVPPVVTWARTQLGDQDRTKVEGLDRDPLALARTLDQFGIGIEPDVRFGGLPPHGEAVLFRFERPPVTSPSPAYATALVTLELCAAVAAADGAENDAEDALLVEQVGRVEGLLDAERARLAAHRELLRSTQADLTEAARRIGDPEQRRQLGGYLVEVARVDGEVSEPERRTLDRIHALLGLPAPDLDVTETLDRQRLERTRASNTEVQELLAAIFADDDEDEDEAPQQQPEETIAGLDARHSALLRELAAAGTWSRTEWEAGAKKHRVLPDGALEIINEAALDATGESVIELDDDSVTIDPDVYREMPA